MQPKSEVEKYRLINYFDVWYNEEEGYQVNNLCEEGTIELENPSSKNEIVVKLIQAGFLKSTVQPNQVDVWNDYDMIEFYEAGSGEPLGRLERIM